MGAWPRSLLYAAANRQVRSLLRGKTDICLLALLLIEGSRSLNPLPSLLPAVRSHYVEYYPSRFGCVAELYSEYIAIGRPVQYQVILYKSLMELPYVEILKIF